MSTARSEVGFFSSTNPDEFRYVKLQDYVDLELLYEKDVRRRYKGKRKDSIKVSPHFTNHWYILLRYGEYGAQVEKAVSKIYRHFLGYSTKIDIVKDGDHYYAASRELSDFSTWNEVSKEHLTTQEDGKMLYRGLPIKNLARIAALSQFLADTDCTAFNFGLQKRSDAYYVVKIDNEHAFNFERQEMKQGVCSIEGEFIFLPRHLKAIESSGFLEEKQMMMSLIANTDFSFFEGILRATITSNEIDSFRFVMNYLLARYAKQEAQRHDTSSSEEGEVVEGAINSASDVRNRLEEIDKMDPANHGVDNIIKRLRQRHQQLRVDCDLDTTLSVAP